MNDIPRLRILCILYSLSYRIIEHQIVKRNLEISKSVSSACSFSIYLSYSNYNMKLLIHEDCCSQCETYIRDANGRNSNGIKVVSMSMVASEQVQLRHMIKKQNTVKVLLDEVNKMVDHESKTEKDPCRNDKGVRDVEKIEELTSSAEENTIDIIVLSMKQNESSLDAQIRGCRAIWSLCFVEYLSKEKRSTNNAVEAILDAMKLYSENSELVEIACEALFQLSSKDVENASLIVEKGGVDVLANAINEHSTIEHVQEKGVSALCSLLYYYDEKYISVHATENIVLELMNIVQRYPESIGLQVRVFWALWTLSGSNHKNKDLINHISKAGTISIILQTMQKKSSNAQIQESSCGILGNLTINNNRNLSDLIKKDGITSILRAARTHENNSKVLAAAYQSFSNMIKTNSGFFLQTPSSENTKSSLVSLLLEKGIMQIIAESMELHSDDAVLQERACILLRILTFDLEAMAILEREIPKKLLETARNKFPQCAENATRLIQRQKFAKI